MKIFNLENGIETAYVQVNDILMLTTMGIKTPLSILIEAYGEDDNTFIQYTNSNAVNFFKNQRGIVDYKQIRKLSNEQLIEKIKILKAVIAKADEKFKRPFFSRSKNQTILQDYFLLKHRLQDAEKLFDYNQGLTEIPFPTALDEDGYICGQIGQIYQVQGALNPNQICINRQDGTKIESGELAAEIVKETMEIVKFNQEKIDWKNFSISDATITEDRKNVIIDIPQEKASKVEVFSMKNKIKQKIKNIKRNFER